MVEQIQGELKTEFYIAHECFAWDSWRKRIQLEITREELLDRIERLKSGESLWSVIPEISSEKNPSQHVFRLMYIEFEELDVFTFVGKDPEDPDEEIERSFTDGEYRSISDTFWTEENSSTAEEETGHFLLKELQVA